MITAPCAPRIRFRDITADDAYLVCRWRNSESARQSFYNQQVVTPDTHRAFLLQRAPHDLIWIIEAVPKPLPPFEGGLCWSGLLTATGPEPIGMLSLTVDVPSRTGEHGRLYLDEQVRGQGYFAEAEQLIEYFSFEVLRLDSIWLSILPSNARTIALHQRGGFEVQRPTVIAGRDALIMTLDAQTYRLRQAAPSGDELRQPAPSSYGVDIMHRAVTEPEGKGW